ncbi:hypothetical protein GCM10008024_09810 [Allgaiera indica]|uniref:Uncharacterized protein n=1 Tax=Allgaiera indica TaxID=765699 RepID=A0AAN4UPR6_9RHOB|nr:hypothetical protein GCM10008024_09810 [Allgaiera indica]
MMCSQLEMARAYLGPRRSYKGAWSSARGWRTGEAWGKPAWSHVRSGARADRVGRARAPRVWRLARDTWATARRRLCLPVGTA